MEHSKTYAGKVQYLDILRILATYLVILLHCASPFITNPKHYNTKTWWFCMAINSIVRAGVPIFFMITGFLLLNSPKTLSITEFYKRRTARIIVPFLAWDIVYFIYYSIGNGSGLSVVRFFKELLVSGSSFHLWYVYTILAIYLFLPFIKKITDAYSVKHLLWFFILIISTTTIRPFLNITTPFYIYLFDPLVNGYLGYVILGYILGKCDMSKGIRCIIYLGGLIGIFINIFGNTAFSSIEKIDLIFNNAYMINHFLTASAIFVFLKYLKPIENVYVNNFITSISMLTYAIYLAHILILEIVKKQFSFSRPIFDICIDFLIVSVVSTTIIWILSKIKYIGGVLV